MTTTTPQRIGGWLLGPLAWLLVALLSTTLALLLYTAALSSPQTFQTLGAQALTTQKMCIRDRRHTLFVCFSPSNWLTNSRDLAASCLAETLMSCSRYPGKQHVRLFTGPLVY